MQCDVLIVGAGPAGSAAARRLAHQGLKVVLADQRAFPRDKVCGDGLISDALGAIEALGLSDRVAQCSVAASELCVAVPSGVVVPLAGAFRCVPRHTLDALLLEGAREAGALVMEGLTAVGPIESGTRVTGARFRSSNGERHVTAPITLLATGANASALNAFGLDVPLHASAAAGRAYFEAPEDVAARFPSLLIAYDREWCPGYGWIFPSPGGRFNIGVGLFRGETGGGRLRAFWEFFTTRFAAAAEIVRASRQLTPFRGAPLRTGLTAAQFGRPGMLAIGEAAAVTYAATGEGIGKAMESGLLAAELSQEAVSGRRSIETLHHEYGAEFRRRFAFRYRAYEVAQAWAAHPVILNILAGRAKRGRFARHQLEALIAERGDARTLFSLRGLAKALLR